MKTKTFRFLTCLSALAISLCACTPTNPYENDPRYDIYQLAVNSGFTGTYQEWLESIKGEDGQNGETPHIGMNGNWWIGDTDTGVPATGPEGPQGPQGEPGKDGSDYERESYTVTFNTNGGSEIDSQVILHGYRIIKPSDPIKENHIFSHWEYMGDEWKFHIYTVTDNMTLDAIWIEEPSVPSSEPSSEEPSSEDIPTEPEWFTGFKAKERNTHNNLPFEVKYDKVYGPYYEVDTSGVKDSKGTYLVLTGVTFLDEKYYSGYEVAICVEGDVKTDIVAWSEDWNNGSNTWLGTFEPGVWKNTVISLASWNGLGNSKGVGLYDILTRGKVKISFGKPIECQSQENVSLLNDNVKNYLDAKNEEDIISALSVTSPYNDANYKRVTFEANNKAPYKVILSSETAISGTKEYITQKDYLDIPYNLIPGETYSYKVLDNTSAVIDEDTFFVQDDYSLRTLKVDGMINVRDLGGYKTANNKTVKYGKLIRGARMNQMTDLGRTQLFSDLGVKTEIDLRVDGNSESGQSNLNYLRYGIAQYTQIIPGYTSPNRYTVADNKNIGPVGHHAPSLASIKNIFTALANENNYPIYFHCNHGADRTGTVAFLIEALLGVSYENILQDFELTSFSKSQSRYRSGVVDGKFDTTSEYAGIYDCSDNNYVAFGKLYELIMEKYAVNTPNNTLQEGVEYYLLNVVGVTQTEINSIKNILLD